MSGRRWGARIRERSGGLVFGAWLVVLWTVLWGEPSWANLVSGVVVAVVLLLAVPRQPVATGVPIVRPWALVSLLVWFGGKLVQSTWQVSLEALRVPSRSRIRAAIVAVPLPGAPPGIVTAVAGAVTLTPGTLTLEVDPEVPVLYVHVMQFVDRAQVRAEVEAFERRVVAAVGSADARAAVAGRASARPEVEP